MDENTRLLQELQERFGEAIIALQSTRDEIPTLWVDREQARDVLRYLKEEIHRPYRMLYDLTAIDERVRGHREGQPASDFMRGAVEGAWNEREALDAAIDDVAEGWTAQRMAVLERNILRLAVWELGAGEVPPAVAIDEAVELAKRYASPEAAVFVNGVLGRRAREQGVGR